jgi:hypothetical protein
MISVFCGEDPRSRRYGRTAALRLLYNLTMKIIIIVIITIIIVLYLVMEHQ